MNTALICKLEFPRQTEQENEMAYTYATFANHKSKAKPEVHDAYNQWGERNVTVTDYPDWMNCEKFNDFERTKLKEVLQLIWPKLTTSRSLMLMQISEVNTTNRQVHDDYPSIVFLLILQIIYHASCLDYHVWYYSRVIRKIQFSVAPGFYAN